MTFVHQRKLFNTSILPLTIVSLVQYLMENFLITMMRLMLLLFNS